MLIAGELLGQKKTGILLESSDGGATWTRRLLAVKPSVADMTFVDATHGWILASDSQSLGLESSSGHGTVVLRTSDGGATWQSANLGKISVAGLTSLAFSDANHGWAMGDMVLKTSDGGATWLDAGVDVPMSPTMDEVPMLRAAVCSGGDVWGVGPCQLVLSTLDTTADTAPPVTMDDGDRLLAQHGCDRAPDRLRRGVGRGANRVPHRRPAGMDDRRRGDLRSADRPQLATAATSSPTGRLTRPAMWSSPTAASC